MLSERPAGVVNERASRKGVAIHPGPESCVAGREVAIQALTRVHAARVWSCEIMRTDAYFWSRFTHSNLQRSLCRHPEGFLGMWRDLAGRSGSQPQYLIAKKTLRENTMSQQSVHRLKGHMLRNRIPVAVVGCGDTGSAVLSGWPYLRHALLAAGHPAGMQVYDIDGDRISESNCVRQPFTSCRSEVEMS